MSRFILNFVETENSNNMSKLETIKRYNLIVKKLRNSTYATFEDIDAYLKRESEIDGLNFSISKRTFQRDLAEIYSIYGVEITFDFSRKHYFISSEDEIEAEVSKRMFEAFDMYNALNVREQLSKFIYFEPNRSQGIEHFNPLLTAIRNRNQVSFSYQKFYKDSEVNRTVNPLILKEFKHRWYIVARDINDNRVKFYALDRISNLEIKKTTFEEETNFDIKEFVKHCYGVMLPPNEEPYQIELSFEPFQGKYIKTLPLHHSQNTLIDNENEFRISLFMFITPDFVMDLLGLGDTFQVIKPIELKNILKEHHTRAVENFS